MTQQTKTPWFDAAVHDPVRPGIYLVMAGGNRPWWRLFDGKDWYAGVAGISYRSPSYEEIMARRHFDVYKVPKANRDFEWCGLTEV